MVRISIITPIKGRPKLFEETLDSVLKQSCQNWEYIVIDDGSQESDYREIKSLCDSNSKVFFLSRDDHGIGASYCRNYGANLAKGDWLVFLDSDDILGENFVKNRIHDVSENSNMDFYAYRALTFKEKPGDSNILWNDFTSENDLDRFLKVDTPWQTTGVLWKKSFFCRIGGFNPFCKNWQDWEVHVRALTENPKYEKIKREIDFFYRKSVLSDISTKNNCKDFLLDRIETISRIIPILVKQNQLSSIRSYYLAKLLFSIDLNLKNLYSVEGFGEVIIERNSLISDLELNLWKWYVSKGFLGVLSGIKNLQKRFIDKLIYFCRQDHFLDTKTNFLNVRYLDKSYELSHKKS